MPYNVCCRSNEPAAEQCLISIVFEFVRSQRVQTRGDAEPSGRRRRWSTSMPIHATNQGWVLETDTTGYALGLNAAGLLTHRYWGPRLPRSEDYPPAPDPWLPGSLNDPPHQLTPEEYPAYAGLNFVGPCLKVTFGDGVRDVVLRYDSAEMPDGAPDELLIHLRDAYYPLAVTLRYHVHNEYDLIE